MITLYDPLKIYMDELDNHKGNGKLSYYASDIIQSLGLEMEELQNAVFRAIKICSLLDISMDKNFKVIYRSTGDNVLVDWKISALACYLITINATPTNRKVAQAQLFFFSE